MKRLHMGKKVERNYVLFNANYLDVLFAARAAQNSLSCFVGYLYRTYIMIYTFMHHFLCLTTVCHPLTKPEFSSIFKGRAILGSKTRMTSRLPPVKSRNLLIFVTQQPTTLKPPTALHLIRCVSHNPSNGQ